MKVDYVMGIKVQKFTITQNWDKYQTKKNQQFLKRNIYLRSEILNAVNVKNIIFFWIPGVHISMIWKSYCCHGCYS
jgi:hypothetical protein